MPTVLEASPPSTQRYRVLRPLGRGGLSAVYLARDEGLDRDVALKVMRGPGGATDAARARLWFEAEITAGLEHPGVVPVYHRGLDDSGNAYFTMRYVRGETFAAASDRAREAPSAAARKRGLRRLVDRLVDVCYTVAYANGRGVVHRDLTPGNLMLGRHGETVVVDWGLARLLGAPEPDGPAWGDADGGGEPEFSFSGELSRTRTGKAIGTPRYMSPEQAEGRWRDVGPATDVFGIGATLYRLLTGRAPFADADPDVSQARAAGVDCPAPREVDRTVPVALESVCLKAMMFAPEARYASAIDLGDDLARWVAGEPVSAPRKTLREWDRGKKRDGGPLSRVPPL